MPFLTCTKRVPSLAAYTTRTRRSRSSARRNPQAWANRMCACQCAGRKCRSWPAGPRERVMLLRVRVGIPTAAASFQLPKNRRSAARSLCTRVLLSFKVQLKCYRRNAAFSRSLFGYYPLVNRLLVLCLLGVDEMCSTQWTICVPSRHSWNCARKMKERLLCRCGPRPSVSSRGARTASCLFRRTVTAQLSFLLSTLLAVHEA